LSVTLEASILTANKDMEDKMTFKKHFLISVFIFASFLMTACMSAAKGDIFAPEKITDKKSGVIYVSREKALVGAVMAANVDLDGAKIAELDQGGYLAITVKEGTHSIRLYAGLYNKIFEVKVKKGTFTMLRIEGSEIKVVDPGKEPYKSELKNKVLQKRITKP